MEPDMKEYPTWECRRCIEKKVRILTTFGSVMTIYNVRVI